MPVISLGEIGEGILGSSDPELARTQFERLLTGFAVLDVTAAVAAEYARVARELRARGNLIPANDLWIAATALAHGIALVTGNRRHFERVPGLPLL